MNYSGSPKQITFFEIQSDLDSEALVENVLQTDAFIMSNINHILQWLGNKNIYISFQEQKTKQSHIFMTAKPGHVLTKADSGSLCDISRQPNSFDMFCATKKTHRRKMKDKCIL